MHKTLVALALCAAVLLPYGASAAMTPEERLDCIAEAREKLVVANTLSKSIRGMITQIAYNTYSARIAASASITDEGARRAEIDAAKAAYQVELGKIETWYKTQLNTAKFVYSLDVSACK